MKEKIRKGKRRKEKEKFPNNMSKNSQDVRKIQKTVYCGTDTYIIPRRFVLS